MVALQNNRLTSAKRKWVIRGEYLPREYPRISPWHAALLMRPCNPSVHRRNRKGESRSPCQIPLEGCIMPLASPLTSIEYDTDVTLSIGSLIH